MPLHALQSTVLSADITAKIAAGASVKVYDETDQSLVQLWQDREGTTSAGNPVVADSTGHFLVYLDAGRYRLEITYGTWSQQIRDHEVGSDVEDIKDEVVAAAATFVDSVIYPPHMNINLAANEMHTIPAGLSNYEHVTFHITGDYGTANTGIQLDDDAMVDYLRVRVPQGVTRADRMIRLGNGARVGVIDVESEDQLGGHDEKNDGFIQFRGDDIEVWKIIGRNIDRVLFGIDATKIRVGRFECESYVIGVRLDTCTDVEFDKFLTRIKSPNATTDPGNNGLTLSDCVDNRFPWVYIQDSGEHGVYIAGGDQAGISNSKIRFGKLQVDRPGQNGLKCKSEGTTRHYDIGVENLWVVDAAYGNSPGPNENGMQVQGTDHFHIGTFRSTFQNTTRAGYAGLMLDGVTDFSLQSGYVHHSQGPMVLIEDAWGDSDTIVIKGLCGHDIRSHGYHLNFNNGGKLSNLDVSGGSLNRVVGDAIRIEAPANTSLTPNLIDLRAAQVTGSLINNLSSDTNFDLMVRSLAA